LNALKEVHLILAEGMHNQYGDLTWTPPRDADDAMDAGAS
jgi:hypothetical protein